MDKDIFAMAKWATTTGRFVPPPLKDSAGRLHSTAPARASLLRSTHLPNDRTAEDIIPTPSPASAEPWLPVTVREVERAVLHSRNTAPE